MSASGTFGYGLEFTPFYDISRLGAVIVKGLSLLPTPGNAPGRIVETPAGMLNAIGLQNIGVERFVNEVRRGLPTAGRRVRREHLRPHDRGVRGGGPKALRGPALAAIELNASCPNVKEGGSPSVRNPEGLSVSPGGACRHGEAVVGKALPERVGHRRDRRRAAEEAGADAVDPHQHHRGMAVDCRTRRPILSKRDGRPFRARGEAGGASDGVGACRAVKIRWSDRGIQSRGRPRVPAGGRRRGAGGTGELPQPERLRRDHRRDPGFFPPGEDLRLTTTAGSSSCGSKRNVLWGSAVSL